VNRVARRWVNSLTVSTLALAMLAGCSRRDAAESTAFESTEIGYSASGIELIQTDVEGRIRYQLTATELAQDPRSREMRLAKIDLRLKTADNAWQATALSATLSADARNSPSVSKWYSRPKDNGHYGYARKPWITTWRPVEHEVQARLASVLTRES